jgi:ABC-type antimicrobial peptide transport system permease subunit
MLKTSFRLALRNLAKSPVSTLIKLFGLAVGVSGCLIIFLIARYELSFDKFQPDRDRVYRIYCKFSGLWEGSNRGVPLALPAKVRSEFTGLEAVSFFFTYSAKVTVIDSTGARRKFEEQSPLAIAGPDYFEVFGFYQWIAGDPKALAAPFTVALTETKALNYFGTTRPDKVIGKPIIYRDSLEVTVVGIIKDIKEQTDFQFTDFISFATVQSSWLKQSYSDMNDWGSVSSGWQCFVKLSEGTPISKIEDQMPILMKARQAQQKEEQDTKTEFKLQPLSDLHYNTDLFIFDSSPSAVSLGTLKTLGVIAILLLVIAAINFINLETAQAVRRSKEVGLRKVMGGSRLGLVWHFLTESFLIASLAVFLAIPMCYACFTLFGEFMPKGLSFRLADPFMWGFLALTALVVGGLAGIYPAFVLSSYEPAVALKNQMVSGGQSRSAFLRKILTVMQFSFSQVLIVGTLIVGMQISFMISKDLGFTSNSIVYFSAPWWDKTSKVEQLRNELSNIPEIVAISRNSRMPASSGWSSTTVTYNNGKEDKKNTVHVKSGDTSYISVFRMKLLAGRNVQPSDSARELLINETFCKKLGFEPRDALNIQLKASGDKMWTVVGVLADFHFQSLHNKIEPMYFKFEPSGRTMALQLALTGNELKNVEQALVKINGAIKKVYPDEKIECQFFDDSIEKLYQSEKRIAKLTNIATGLAIFISCLGLFGLASYTAVQRTKEIGIRKVLGATVNNIVTLLSREFLVLVTIAFVIAVPVAWFTADKWLGDFAFRVEIGVGVFALAGFLSVLIAFVTVGSQALKAAVADPAESLRYE